MAPPWPWPDPGDESPKPLFLHIPATNILFFWFLLSNIFWLLSRRCAAAARAADDRVVAAAGPSKARSHIENFTILFAAFGQRVFFLHTSGVKCNFRLDDL